MSTPQPELSLPLSPAAERNKQPILDALRTRLPAAPSGGRVLEVASGTGQHVAHFAAHLPHLTFQPTEADGARLPQLAAMTAGLPNVLPPAQLDAAAAPWDLTGPFVAALCANMVHIAPWACAQGLLRGVSALGAPLYLYGPFRFHGAFTAPSNAAFDQSLRERDPAWGVRDVDDLTAAAARYGLRLREVIDMPNNNHILAWAPAP